MAELSPTSSLSFRAPERPSSVITTFYSFKGGVGRTQSLFNVGARLAAVRRNVMMVDVDLEAPGLSIGVLTEEQRRSKEGFSEIARDLLADLKDAFAGSTTKKYLTAVQARYTARIRRALHEVRSPLPPKNEDLEDRIQRELDATLPDPGSLYLLSTGRVGSDYTRQVAQLPLAEAYNDALDAASQSVVRSMAEDFETRVDPDRLDTRGRVFAALMREMLRTVAVPRRDDAFDHVLVDSRSGLADVGGLCLLGLAETRVVLSGLNRQNVTGTQMALDRVADPGDEARDDDHLIVVFSPVPEGELDLLAKRLEEAKKTLHADADQVRLLHYHPRIALEEKAFAEPVHEYTRIYDEYEDLTDHLLHLTGNDAHTLVSHALEQFREAEDEDGNRYQDLVDALISAAFLDEDHVESVLDGLCTEIKSRDEPKRVALPLFHLWIAVTSDDSSTGTSRSLSTTVDYYTDLRQESDLNDDDEAALLRREIRYYEVLADLVPAVAVVWSNWGIHLARLAQLVESDDRAESLFRDAFNKFDHATDLQPDDHQAWYNWGTDLANLAQRVEDDDRAESLFLDAFDKYERATDLQPDDHQAWYNWGTGLTRLAERAEDDDRAESLFRDAFNKYERATDLQPAHYLAWNNWGNALANLAERVEDDDHAESLFRDAFDKYDRATDLNPDDYRAWSNWGIYLLRLYHLQQRSDRKGDELLSESIQKFRSAKEHGGDLPPILIGLTSALAERGEESDVDEAADLLRTLLDSDPSYLSWFEDEDIEPIRSHPQLRDILDEYREEVDEEDLEDADLPDTLGLADAGELEG